MSDASASGVSIPANQGVSPDEMAILRDLIAQHDHTQQRIAAERARAEQARRDELDYWKAQADAARAQVQTARVRAQTSNDHTSPTASVSREKKTAVVRGETVDRVAVGMMRYGAISILAVSFVGSVVALNTGWPLRSGWQPIIAAWPRPWEGISPLAVVVGLLVQGWLTLVQWHKRKQKRGLLYLSHLGTDAALTCVGYYPILGPIFAAALAKLTLPQPWDALIAAVIMVLLAFVVAKVPEEMLVEE